MRTPDVVSMEGLIYRSISAPEVDPLVLGLKLDAIRKVENERSVDGWMLLECADLSSSHMGELVLLPFGEGCTFKAPPERPISPRGLASDMSVVIAIAFRRDR